MLSFKKVLPLMMIAAVSLFFVGCGGNKAIKDYGDKKDASGVYPKEIQRLIDKEYKESIWAVGMGTHVDEQAAIKIAGMDATTKIARQFEQEVTVANQSYSKITSDGVDLAQIEGTQIFVNVKLHGDKEIRTMTVRGKDGFRAYVMRALDAAAFAEMLKQQKEAMTYMEATDYWKDMEARVEREKASRQ